MIFFSAADTPAWTLATALASGGLAGLVAWLAGRRVNRAQTAQLKVSVQAQAVEIVETALTVAKDRITVLESEVEKMTERIGRLRAELDHAGADRGDLKRKLDLVLAERAVLKEQIEEIHRHLEGKNVIAYLPAVRPPDAIVMVDMISGMIDYASEGVYTLLGYAPGDLVGQPLNMLIPEDRRASHTRHRAMYAEHPRARAMGTGLDLQARCADRATIPVDISLHPTGDGRVIALVKKRRA